MNIIFICGSLEPGKDGVGDYTRRLACELVRIGHSCSIIALMDKFISVKLLEPQECDNQIVEVLRLPFNDGYKLNCNIAKARIEKLEPEWISIQFVLFIFDSRGLPLGLAKTLKKMLVRNVKLHIMFHELWVGMDTKATLKEKVWGIIQSLIIFKVIAKLHPSVVHTHTQLYKEQIKTTYKNVEILKLFGSIPFIPTNNETNELKNEIVVFGGIHKGALIEDFGKILQENKDLFHPPIKVVFIGRNGSELEKWQTICTKLDINTDVVGEQPVEIISKRLQNAIAGISTTPLILAEKSSAVAALLDYNLTVLNLGRDWKPRAFTNIKPTNDIVDFKLFVDIYHSLKTAPNSEYKNSLHQCSILFINDLNSISN